MMAKNEKRSLRLTPEQLEAMTSHEVADLLANLVLILRRLPDVPMVDLQSSTSEVWATHSRVRSKTHGEKVDDQGEPKDLPAWTKEE